MRNHRRFMILLCTSVAAIAIVACGDDSDTDASSETEAAVTPEQAIEEIAAVRAGLADGLDQYRDDDAATAEDTVSETYLEHFELVEVPLEEADPELNEELEVLIRETITDAIATGAAVNVVTGLVDDANSGLDDAETALQGSSSAEQDASSDSGSSY